MTVIAVDHGEKRIGVAVSDATRRLARPLATLKHIARNDDARRVAELAKQNGADLIVVGFSTDEAGLPNAAGRRAGKFAEALRNLWASEVVLWDESLSTRDAQARRLAADVRRKRRSMPIDAEAAAFILQSYLDSIADDFPPGTR